MRIYACRHGETEWTVSGQHTGTTDIPLTKTGERQVEFLKEKLRKIEFAKVISSPRLRAMETCRLAGFYPEVDADACEWDYGLYEGKTKEEIWEDRPAWNVFSEGAPDGESPEEVGARADRLLKKLARVNGNVVLFSHGHFCRVLAARWLELPPGMGRHFNLSVASLSVLESDRGCPVISLWNEIF